MVRLALVGLVVAALAAPLAWGAQLEQVGNVLFVLPAGWRAQEQDQVTYLVPGDLPAGKTAALAILPGEKLEGELPAAFDAQWASLTEGNTVLEGGKASEIVPAAGYEFIYALARVKDAEGKTSLVYAMLAQAGDQAQPFLFVADDEDLFKRYFPAFAAFLKDLTFANLRPAEPPAVPAPTPGAEPGVKLSPSFTWGQVPSATGNAGLSGTYTILGFEREVSVLTGVPVTDLKHFYWTFFPDGRCFYSMPQEGFENFNYAYLTKVSPFAQGTYKLTGDLGLITWGATMSKTTAFKRVGDDLYIGPDKDHYVPVDPCTGLKLEGTYRRYDWQQEYAPRQALSFTRDGRFTDEGFLKGAVFMWWFTPEQGGSVETSANPGSGTYRLSRNSLELLYSDGRKFRVSFTLADNATRADPKGILLNGWQYLRMK